MSTRIDSSIEWLLDDADRVVGYRTTKGIEYTIGGSLVPPGSTPIPGAGTGFVVSPLIGAAVATIDGNQYAALPVNANGDVVANLVPRTGLLADLLQLAGSPGEIAVATDAKAIVRYSGVIGEAVVAADGQDVVVVEVPATGTGVYDPGPLPEADVIVVKTPVGGTTYTSVSIPDVNPGRTKARVTLMNDSDLSVTWPVASPTPPKSAETAVLSIDSGEFIYYSTGAVTRLDAGSAGGLGNFGRQFIHGIVLGAIGKNTTAIGVQTRAAQLQQVAVGQLANPLFAGGVCVGASGSSARQIQVVQQRASIPAATTNTLTCDGTAVSTAPVNVIDTAATGTPASYTMYVEATTVLRTPNTTNFRAFKHRFVVVRNAGATTIVNTQQLDETNSGITDATVAFAVSGSQVLVNVTAGAAVVGAACTLNMTLRT